MLTFFLFLNTDENTYNTNTNIIQYKYIQENIKKHSTSIPDMITRMIIG